MERGLATLGIAGKALPELPKGAQEKLALAWWLRRHRTQSRKWIDGRLHISHESRVTRAAREVSRSRRGRLARMRNLGEDVHCNKIMLIKLSDYGTDPFTNSAAK